MADDPSWRGRLATIARLRTPSRQVRGVLLLVAGIATVIAVVFALRGLDIRIEDLRAAPLIAAAVLITPLTVGLNAAELRVTAMGSGAVLERLGWTRAIRTVVLATAANLLPVPAGAVLRVQVLRDAGARTAAAAAVQLSAAAVWIGVSVALAGAVLLGSGSTWSLIGLFGGLVLAGGGLVSLRQTATTRPGLAAGALFGVELATAVVHAGRLWLILVGLGIEASLGQAVVIAAAAPIAAAAGFFPGGIGLAELLSALLAPLAGLSAAAGLLAVAVGRVLGLAVTVPVAVALGLRDLVRGAAGGQDLTEHHPRPEVEEPEVER